MIEVGPDTFSELFQIKTKGRKFSVTRDKTGKIQSRWDEWPHTERVFLTGALRYFHCWVGWLPSLAGTQTSLAMMMQMPGRCNQCALPLRQQNAVNRCDKDTNTHTLLPGDFPVSPENTWTQRNLSTQRWACRYPQRQAGGIAMLYVFAGWFSLGNGLV